MSFAARTERVGTATVVVFTGELGIASEAPAAAALEAAIGDGGVPVADLRELSFLDSTRPACACCSPPTCTRGSGPCASAWHVATGWSGSSSTSRASTSASPSAALMEDAAQ